MAPTLAVLDAGVDRLHPALERRCLIGQSFDRATADVSPDTSHHGTLAALLAVGEKVGVAPFAQLLPVRYTGNRPAEWQESMKWAAENADVVLCPWVLDPRTSVARALERTLERDCLDRALFVGAVGNRFYTVGFPACHSGVLGVGAITSEGTLATYSGRGEGLDVLAPSDGGRLSLPAFQVYQGRGQSRRQQGFQRLGGTSAAAALAAGVALRLSTSRPDLAPHRLLSLLRTTVTLPAKSAIPSTIPPRLGCLNYAAAIELASQTQFSGTLS